MFYRFPCTNCAISRLRCLNSIQNINLKQITIFIKNSYYYDHKILKPRFKNIIKSSYIRNISSSFHRLNDINREENKKVCEIGEGSWEEVYKGVLTTQFKLLKMFSIGSSILCLSLQPLLYEHLCNSNLALVVGFGTFVGFLTFASPCLIHLISKKYVTRLEYDSERDVYAATTLSFFLREKKVHFTIDEIIRPAAPGMFTSFVVKNKALFVDPEQFEDLEHYSRLLGYDKPIDFRLDDYKKKDS